MAVSTDSIKIDAIPRVQDITSIAEELIALLEAHGLAHSWQKMTNDNAGLLNQMGLYPLLPEHVEKWDPKLAKGLFSLTPGMKTLYVDPNGQITLGDTVLMVMRKDDRDELFAQEEIKMARQQGQPRGEMEKLKEQLASLGISSSITDGEVTVRGK